MKSFKVLIIVLFSLLLGKESLAQTVFNSNFYGQNRFSINPAYAGNQEQLFVSLQVLNQSRGSVNNSPKSYSFNAHTLAYDNLGLGVRMSLNRAGFFETNIFEVAGAYKAIFAENHSITFGINTGFQRERLNMDNIIINPYVDQTDPTLNSGAYDATRYRMGTGFVYRYKNLEVSGSLPSLVLSGKKINLDFIAYSGYDFFLPNGKWMIRPSFLYRTPDGNKNLVDGNIMAEWDQTIWTQVGYRSNQTVNFSVGVNIDFVGFAYSYGRPVGDLSELSSNNHEFLITMKFGNKDQSKNVPTSGSRYGNKRIKIRSERKNEIARLSEEANTREQRYQELQEKIEKQDSISQLSNNDTELDAVNAELADLKNQLELLKEEIDGAADTDGIELLEGKMEPGYYVVISTCANVECAKSEQKKFLESVGRETDIAINKKKGFFYIFTHKLDDFDESLKLMQSLRKTGHEDAWVLVHK